MIALCTNKWQIGAALTLMGAFASIYHPVGIPMLVQKAKNPGFTIGVNGLVGNLGIAIGASVSVYSPALRLADGLHRAGRDLPGRAPWPSWRWCRRSEEAPAKRKAKMIDLPPGVMARVFFIMTCAAVTGSIVFNFTTNGNGEMLKARVEELAARSGRAAEHRAVRDLLAGVARPARGRHADRPLSAEDHLPADPARCRCRCSCSRPMSEGWALFVA